MKNIWNSIVYDWNEEPLGGKIAMLIFGIFILVTLIAVIAALVSIILSGNPFLVLGTLFFLALFWACGYAFVNW